MEYVYRIVDHVGAVRYVGRSKNPYRRLQKHIYFSRRAGDRFGIWLRRYLHEGRFPDVVIVGLVDADAERNEVQACLLAGHPVLNVCYARVYRRVSFSISPERFRRMERERKRLGWTRSKYVEAALDYYFGKRQRKAPKVRELRVDPAEETA